MAFSTPHDPHSRAIRPLSKMRPPSLLIDIDPSFEVDGSGERGEQRHFPLKGISRFDLECFLSCEAVIKDCSSDFSNIVLTLREVVRSFNMARGALTGCG